MTPQQGLHLPRTVEQKKKSAAANAKRKALADQRAMMALEMRSVEGKTYAQIGADLGISPGSAQDAYRRGVAMSVPRDAMDEAKALALQKLDIWEQMALEQYHARHVLVSHGKVARRLVNGELEVVEDYLPKLRAIDLLLKIERERRTIIGYTAPSRRVLEVITEDQLERALRQYNEEAERLERETAEIEARRNAAR